MPFFRALPAGLANRADGVWQALPYFFLSVRILCFFVLYRRQNASYWIAKDTGSHPEQYFGGLSPSFVQNRRIPAQVDTRPTVRRYGRREFVADLSVHPSTELPSEAPKPSGKRQKKKRTTPEAMDREKQRERKQQPDRKQRSCSHAFELFR